MSTRKIKDAELDGEKVYFASHAKATYMSDGTTVEDAIKNIGVGGGGGGITIESDPIFSASAAAKITEENISSWNNKVDKVSGKQLSTEDFTTLLKQKLDGLSNYDDTTISQAVQSLQTQIAAKGTYSKPSTGIPKSDLAGSVQNSLNKADTALQSYTEQYKGTVTGVKINGSTKTPNTDGIVDLGTIEAGGVTEEYVNNAIASAITTTLTTAV